jgi:ADP-ribose pyrophosphatase YjhB (NUDIX family)
MKDIKYTIAVALKKAEDSNEFLVVRRPADDADLADSWGLPAVTLLPGELPEDGAVRVCREKLGAQQRPRVSWVLCSRSAMRTIYS